MAGAVAGAYARPTGQASLGALGDYLRLGRVQTAAMTVPTALVPYWLATGRFDLVAWLWVLWAFAVHYCGLATNNLMDLPFDKVDRNKAMFPLVSGRLTERQGWGANLVAHAVAIGLPLLLAPNALVAGWVMAGLAGGWAYCLTCKIHPWSLLWHHVFMAGLVLVPFFAYASQPSMALLAWLMVMELILTYQLMVEGPSKDAGVRQTPYDWGKLRRGTRLGIALSLRAASVAASLWLAWATAGLGLVALAGVAFFAAVALAVAVPTALKPANLKLFSVNEVSVYTMGIAALLPVLGARWAVVLVLAPLTWYLACNRALWGRWGAPRI
jgi:4-hydroxybenzoate polyprenyltransferase